MSEDDIATANRTPPAQILGWLGIILYVAVGWLYLVSGLVVPAPWLYLLWVIWFGGWVVVARMFRTRRAWTVVVAVAAAAAWVLILYLGDILLGWTA